MAVGFGPFVGFGMNTGALPLANLARSYSKRQMKDLVCLTNASANEKRSADTPSGYCLQICTDSNACKGYFHTTTWQAVCTSSNNTVPMYVPCSSSSPAATWCIICPSSPKCTDSNECKKSTSFPATMLSVRQPSRPESMTSSPPRIPPLYKKQ